MDQLSRTAMVKRSRMVERIVKAQKKDQLLFFKLDLDNIEKKI